MKKSASFIIPGMQTRSYNMATSKVTKSNAEGNENKMDGFRKLKIEAVNTKTKGLGNGQRAPLGAIAQNISVVQKRQIKQDPSGGAINKLQKENKVGKEVEVVPQSLKQRSTFTIHHDEAGPSEASENITTVLVEHSSTKYDDCREPEREEPKTELAVSMRQPLGALSLNADNFKVSPMVLDTSSILDSGSKENSEPIREPTSFNAIRDELFVPEYAQDIYENLRSAEVRFRPKPNYMRKQPDITTGMRSILVDWLVEVGQEYGLEQETLYLAVGYVDRFLSLMSVLRGKLQLVGTACMFVAAKYEEIHPPDIEEFVYITDDTYNKKQVLRMEQIILRVLAFDLAAPTAHYFLERFILLGKLDTKCQHLAFYLSELALLEAEPYLQFLPSIIAGSAVCLACHTLDKEPWNSELEEFTNYKIEDFKPCLSFLQKSFSNAAKYPQQSVREKYADKKFSEVSKILPHIIPLE